MEVKIGGDSTSPLTVHLDHGYQIPVRLEGDVNLNITLHTTSLENNKIETLTTLLGNLLKFRESDLAKLSLLDREEEITGIINTVINKIDFELRMY